MGERGRLAAVIGLPTAGYGAVGVHRMLTAPAWLDERLTMRLARASWGGWWAGLHTRDFAFTAPYYLLARAVPNLTALRLISVAAVCGAIVLAGLIAHHLGGPVPAGVTSLVLACNPQLNFIQTINARSYGLAVLAVTVVGWSVVVHGGRRWTPVVGALGVAASVWTLLPAVAVAWRDRRTVIAAGAVAAAMTGFALTQPAVDWIPTSGLPQGFHGLLYHWFNNTVGIYPMLLLIISAALGVRWWRHGQIVVWWLAPSLVIAVASQVQPVMIARYLIGTVPAAAILVGLAASGLVDRIAVVLGQSDQRRVHRSTSRRLPPPSPGVTVSDVVANATLGRPSRSCHRRRPSPRRTADPRP